MSTIEEWKSQLPEKVSSEMSIASFEQAGEMIRIDLERIYNFVPRNSMRQNKREDDTIPRVCVCDSLMGCIAGYASFFHDFNVATTNGKWTLNGTHFKGGMYIHRLPYRDLIIPSDKLAGDSSVSGEKWLVGYDEASAAYPSELIGKVFISGYSCERVDGKAVIHDYSIYLEIAEGESLKLTPKRTLAAGYWLLKLKVRVDNLKIIMSEEPPCLSADRIDQTQYFQAKSQGIDLLQDRLKISSTW